MRIHFIAIGGSAMHNLALALHQKEGIIITGSDDEIFEPSRSRLEKCGLLPKEQGWFPEKITKEIDAIVLGMHARKDNQELIRANELGIKIYSYPEYLYEATKDKTRVVIGGSHGKTSITSMIMHVLRFNQVDFDYMVGAQLEGFDNMVRLSHTAKIAVFEGDEYLSSALDPRPKFHLYKPNIALINGIAWDHINVFPTFENYVEQFQIFTDKIEPSGKLVYYQDDEHVKVVSFASRKDIEKIPFGEHAYITEKNQTYLLVNEQRIPIQVFGKHNMQNLSGAKEVCHLLGINDSQFYTAISNFNGSAKRLQLLGKNEHTNVYLDFAHSPSKLKATVSAVKEQFPTRKLVACMELHTFSSLTEEFLELYKDSMEKADEAYVYFNPKTIAHKKLKPISEEMVLKAFGSKNIQVSTNSEALINMLTNMSSKDTNFLLMTSGNFDGVDFKNLSLQLI